MKFDQLDRERHEPPRTGQLNVQSDRKRFIKINSVDFASIVRTQNDRTGPPIVVAIANAFVPIEHFPGRWQFTGNLDGLVIGTAELDVNARVIWRRHVMHSRDGAHRRSNAHVRRLNSINFYAMWVFPTGRA